MPAETPTPNNASDPNKRGIWYRKDDGFTKNRPAGSKKSEAPPPEPNIVVDPGMYAVDHLQEALKKQEDEVRKWQQKLERNSDKTIGSFTAYTWETPEEGRKKSIEGAAASLRQAFEEAEALKEALNALRETGSLESALKYLEEKETSIAENMRRKREEINAANERGDARGASILEDEMESFRVMLGRATSARERLATFG